MVYKKGYKIRGQITGERIGWVIVYEGKKYVGRMRNLWNLETLYLSSDCYRNLFRQIGKRFVTCRYTLSRRFPLSIYCIVELWKFHIEKVFIEF